jgi:hypothetical protein
MIRGIGGLMRRYIMVSVSKLSHQPADRIQVTAKSRKQAADKT